ncbi:hypothetical protein Tco_1226233 [Tanacetum coccineum]
MQTEHTNSSNSINTVSTPISTAGPSLNTVVPSTPVNTAGPSVSTANEFEEHLFERFSPFKKHYRFHCPNSTSMDNTASFWNAYMMNAMYPHIPINFTKRRKGSLWTTSGPKSMVETLSTYLLENGFYRGQIDKTLFIKRHKDDILLVQVYVDDIIFGSTKKEMIKTASTPMETNKALIKDEEAEDVDVHLYRSMIGSLMYLTASRPDIMFVVCACARDLPFDFQLFSDSDDQDLVLNRKSTTEIQALVDWKKIIVNKTSIRRDLKLEDAEGSPCLSNATIFKELTRMGAMTTAWNEFSSTMASAIICLANNQKFNFSKYIFDNMLGDMSKHKKTFVNPSLTKKLFRNMKREGTGFSGKVLDLEKAKSDQAIEIASLKKRVEKLERRRKFRTIRLQRLKKVGSASRIESSNDSLSAQEDASKRERKIKDIDADVEMFVDATTGEKDEHNTKINDSTAGEAVTTAGINDSIAGEAVTTAGVKDSAVPTIPTTVEESLAQTLMEHQEKSRKRATTRIFKETKMEDDKETEEHEEVEADDTYELKKHLVIVKDDDIAIDAIPLATKPPVILQGIDREDLQTLWKLVKTKYGDSRPEDDHERVLWGDLKVMFEPDIKSDCRNPF